ncbi:hypothetical protein [Massilia sp. DD77]|uniref:hypothetical protein n=1 Tax=Massilia sp. DD77 TaxID=3109349 RepID=UPI00300091A6
MADPDQLSKRQTLFLKRAAAVTREQFSLAQEIAEEEFSLDPDDVSDELIVRIAQVIATNYHASLSDSNSPS